MVGPAALLAVQAGASVIGAGFSIMEGLNKAELLEQRGEAMKQYYKDQARVNKITESRKATQTLQSGIASAGARGVTSFDTAYADAYDINLASAFQRAQYRQQARLAEFDALVGAQSARAEGFSNALKGIAGAAGNVSSGVKK
jgi:hypothetical protein